MLRDEDLRDRAAEPTLRRIRADRERVPARLRPLLSTIEENLFDVGFSAGRLLRENGIRDHSFSTVFSSYLERTPWAYVIDARLEVAARLLAQTNLKPWRIAAVVGYSPQSLGKAFKERYGRTPSEYRRDPGADSSAWTAPLDPEELEQALAGKVSPRQALVLRRKLRTILAHLGSVYATEPEPEPLSRAPAPASFDDLVESADRAFALGDPDTALAHLGRADAVTPASRRPALEARRGLVYHGRGASRTFFGDVDNAYDDLGRARQAYEAAGDRLPRRVVRGRRRITVPWDTDHALKDAFCPNCRNLLLRDVGQTARFHLRRALTPIPRDLEWFVHCCDDCYRTYWHAIGRARFGMVDDAFRAWWLSRHADTLDPETPPSLGRVIAALFEADRLIYQDQEERRKFCQMALDDTVVLGDPLLEAQARIYLGNALRAVSRFSEARAELRKAVETSRKNPWLSALQDRIAGVLEHYSGDHQRALSFLHASATGYRKLDPHVAGLLLIQQANVLHDCERYEESIAFDQASLEHLDDRRDSEAAFVAVPIHLAISFARLEDWERAEAALSRCCFGREVPAGLAATEILTWACLKLGKGCPEESLSLFDEAKQRFEKLHRPLDVALATTYSVEAYARIGDRKNAAASATIALKFFQAAGCSQHTLVAFGELQNLLVEDELDPKAVITTVRSIATQNGGWLPQPGSA